MLGFEFEWGFYAREVFHYFLRLPRQVYNPPPAIDDKYIPKIFIISPTSEMLPLCDDIRTPGIRTEVCVGGG